MLNWSPSPGMRVPRPKPRWMLGVVVAGCLLGLVSPGLAKSPAKPSAPSVPAGFTIQKVAAAPTGASNCDDLAYLDGHLFMACQNKTQSAGGGGNSTIVEFTGRGTVLGTWSLADKADGITGDPAQHRLIITLNEDASSHLATLTPSAPAGQQITNYSYSVNPASPTARGPLHTGGGTDAVSIDSRGRIYISASYGIAKTGTAVFKASLKAPSSPSRNGVATLSPTFLDNATATSGNPGGATQKLKLVDVDSNAIVPYTSPRFGGQFVIDDQTALELVFSSNIDAGTGLTVVKTPYGLDDVRWATTDGGTMYVVDKGPASSGSSALYKITGPFVAGTAFGTNDSIPDQVVTINLTDGSVKPFVRNLQTAKGLVYLDAAGSEPVLPLASAGASATGTQGDATPSAAVAAPKPASDSDALAIVVAAAALVVALGLGGLAISRRLQVLTQARRRT